MGPAFLCIHEMSKKNDSQANITNIISVQLLNTFLEEGRK